MPMKAISNLSVVGQLMLSSALAWGAPPMGEALTREELNQRYQKALQENPMHKMVPAKVADPSVAEQPKNLLDRMDVICFGGAATLVPKRAILNLPRELADRLKFQAGTKIMNWQDFYRFNYGWITTVEVSRAQAEGNKPLDEELVDRIQKSTNLVVATYKGGPISVLPLKETAETANDKP